MTLDLTGKVALVTGASRGIGAGIARRFAHDGAQVFINYVRSEQPARALVDEITQAGGTAHAIQADVGQVSDVRRMFAELDEHASRFDILVNNAIAVRGGRLEDITQANFDAEFAVAVRGPVFCMQEAARRMSEGGRIINISSTITVLGCPGASMYGATKSALEHFTKAIAKELGPRRITVNAVSPGPTDTDQDKPALKGDNRQKMIDLSPLGRLGRPEDIADVVAFLASDAGRWITGHTIHASGGAV